MQITSRAYKDEQKGYLRNEQYIYVYLGVISREAQANAHADGGFVIYSDPQTIFGNNNFEAYYATAEENMARCDASQFFMPRQDAFALWQGLVTQDILGSVTFTFGQYKHLNIKGLTIHFGDYYPTEFRITNGSVGYTYTYTNNVEGIWTCEDEFLDTEFIKIIPLRMVGGQQRLRIHSILFGVGFIFDNTNLISTSWKSEVAHLSDSLPAKSFSFTIDNLSRKFSADNPHSFVAFLEEQQDVEFEFGRKMDDGTIYRIPGGKMNLTSWSSNDQQAKFTAVGKMDYSTGMYNKGQYYPDGISLYDLAVDVCNDAGFEDYIIDTYLKKIITHNPLPVEKHKCLLQLLANAAMAILRETRDGKIEIKTSFEPEIVSIESNGQTDYSSLNNLIDEKILCSEYATAELDYTYADGHQYFLPRNESNYVDVGYTSLQVSNENGIFSGWTENYAHFITDENNDITGIEFDSALLTTQKGKFYGNGLTMSLNHSSSMNPIITIVWESAWTFFNLSLVFTDVYPKNVIIKTYKDGFIRETFTVNDDIDFTTIIKHDFYDIDTLEIEFTETNPYQRIHLNKIIFGDTVDYTIEYMDMSVTPTAIRTDFVKNVSVIYSQFAYGTDIKSVGTVDAVIGENIEESKSAHHDYSLAYKEIKDDDTEHQKANKVFASQLPIVEDAKTNTRYFIPTGNADQYYMYMVETTDGVKSWSLKGTVTQTIVTDLPSTLSANTLYLVRTDKDLIYHDYILYNNNGTDVVLSLGYDVRGTLTIIESGAYYVKFTSDIASPVVVSGKEFAISEQTYSKQLNEIGIDKTATNVLIDNLEHAVKEAEWIKEYYDNDVEYTIQYRGEPALDPDDKIYIENKFVEKNLVRVTDTQINTSTGMSMSCVLHGRRISYTEPARVDHAIVDVSEVSE